MSQILKGIGECVCQLDYLLIHEKNKVEHDQCLKAVLKRLKEKEVTLNRQKCEFENNQSNSFDIF